MGLHVHEHTLGCVLPAVTDLLSLLCCSDTEAQCEVMQEIVDQVLEVRGNPVLRDKVIQYKPSQLTTPLACLTGNGAPTFPSPDEPLLRQGTGVSCSGR